MYENEGNHGNEDEEIEEGWNEVMDDDEQLGSDEEFGSEDEEINSDDC